MSAQNFRRPEGGRIDRDTPRNFTFDGRRYTGYEGDTLASALLANGVRLVGRSFKYHRPRGIFSAGAEEPNALVALGTGNRSEPNTRATTVELFEGLTAHSQNAWPSVRFDLGAVNGLLSPLLSAGFYYKTFMWPAGAWEWYEKFIRRAAGMGRATHQADPDNYESAHDFCDLLIVGAGPAGLAVASVAARSGLRVTVVEEHSQLGGGLRFEREHIGSDSAETWLDRITAELAKRPNVTLLNRTTAFGYYDGNTVGVVERVSDHRAESLPGEPRQRVRLIRAKKVVLATGAIERPLVFVNNDLPGIMLASGVREYCNAYAAIPGRRVVIATNNDSAYQCARDLAESGVTVLAIVDARPHVHGSLIEAIERRGIEIIRGHVVTRAVGSRQLRSVCLAPTGVSHGNATRRIDCDLLAVSGGWSPVIHLQSQRSVKPVFDAALDAFVAAQDTSECVCVGAIRGLTSTVDSIVAGLRTGEDITTQFGHSASDISGLIGLLPKTDVANPLLPLADDRSLRAGSGKAFIDLQTDVTESDVALAHREGYVSVEHLKRYTTLGMGTDQGKTSNLNGMAAMANQRGTSVPAVGTTTFRPPYTPVAMGALAGGATGAHFRPARRTPIHAWHVAHGAHMSEMSSWMRPWYYRSSGADVNAAYVHEMKVVRNGVGMVDVSTLGKIDVQGPDAAEFLNRVYVNNWHSLAVGKARYGVMLRDDGFVFDDGTTSRLADHHFFMTTTTANAAPVLSRLEFLLDTSWPDLQVHVTSVTDQWGAIAVAGPLSRTLLASALQGDFSKETLPFMGCTAALFDDVTVRVHRISFSGELAYEIYCPANDAARLWDRLYKSGKALGVIAYGLEAMGALRTEKGHAAGPELDGRTTLDDLGLGRMAKTKPFAGSVLRKREALCSTDRAVLVGLKPEDPSERLRPGCIVFPEDGPISGHGIGHVTSTTWSPTLAGHIGLGLVKRGQQYAGRKLRAVYPLLGETVSVVVVDPVFLDPEGERVRA
ncbi:sarcosine oxidase subunit alpha family protein [Paraburkholderia aspalathi]|uniref:N-methylglutamate dehydrogenase subunit C n=1 Tax=Paraburkholderia aspalathi TaxID=1324617 RepID=A0A1I7BET2_9BURK|nr:sarcosine oxidase subunit alpha family protein [Paraburkholderia aspalathi]SFT85674.1 N-methylglutamate dehydrogenase subunit C [Paraburkholderia aspalathi]